MPVNIHQYLLENNLYNVTSLRAHSAHNLVEVIDSPKFPSLVMLHYARESQTENSWNTFNRMCRGLILDLKNRRVLSRPFDKFFNIDEQPETKLTNLMKLGKFDVSEKLDGSMLILFRDPNTDKLVLTTKGSFESDHGKYATAILPEGLEAAHVEDFTYMFELVTYKKELRENLVIDYVKKGYPEGVYLIGIRNNQTGVMMDPEAVKQNAEMFGVPVFKTYEFNSLEDMIHHAKKLPVMEEGFVIHFTNENFLVKLKGEDYKRAHRFISRLSPTYLLEGLMYDSIDALIELAPEEYKEDVVKQVDQFKDRKQILHAWVETEFDKAPKDQGRKEFALWVNKNLPGNVRGFMFQLFDKKSLPDWKLYKAIGEQEGLNPRILYEKTKQAR